ncbi:Aste57867_15300 [Aphanomyces stellatus]|uniref:Aste57867_15300 protein n=1 Tax=Aphanomyces stellatus TaxID=120398 RepID=A0A485L2U7_9STRA|nr:hypothetical protein As57867_015244 [Aphanomyces stellatus]VFT92109.1 Aste57867_15300 [Aphanomyces stellatus]
MQAAPLPPRGQVPLADKRRPSEVLLAEDPHLKIVCATTRATDVDVSKLQEALLAVTDERWSEEYQKTQNVSLRRPFHDKVGVNKIICIFSDNHLESVYMLPEWDNWKHLLVPIFDLLEIPLHRVVRALFARMPPKTLIPAHHDNGPWVARTHRIHVPLVTFPEVEFNSGIEETSMQRYAFNAGTVVELNNAAKHSVYNGADKWRVHLIFDVLEDKAPTPTVTTLAAGQLCRQVRGRVELVSAEEQTRTDEASRKGMELLGALKKRLPRAEGERLATATRHFFIEQITATEFATLVRETSPAEMHVDVVAMLRAVDPVMAAEAETALADLTKAFGPSYCILGVQKCGTTSLYRHLGQHPLVLNGKRREPHFFDWFWDHATALPLTASQASLTGQILQRYAFLSDATVAETRAPSDSKEETSSTYSTHDMRCKYLLSVQAPLELFESPMLLADSTPSYLLYGAPIAQRIKHMIPHIRFIVMLRDPVQRAYSHYHMTADPTGTPFQLKMREAVAGKTFDEVMDEDMALLHEVHADPTSLAAFQTYANHLPQTHGCHSYLGRGLYALQLRIWFTHFPRDQFLILNVDNMDTPSSTQATLNRVCAFLRLPPFELQDTSRQNTRAYPPMDDATRAKWAAFYAPHNAALAELVPDLDFHWT